MTGNGTPGERRNSLEAWIVQRFGGPDAKDGLAKHAEKLVLQAGELRAPVRLAKIAQGMGLDPHPIYKPNALDGALKIIDGSLRIVLRHNRSTPPSATSHQYPRLRFSYAHEMSHALFYELGRKPQIRIAPQENYRAEEQLCNFAASRFLIPTFLLQQEVTGMRDLSPELFCALSK